jgi:hypothetical protein
VEESYFPDEFRSIAALDAELHSDSHSEFGMGLRDFAPKQPPLAQKTPLALKSAPPSQAAPLLTDAAGFVSRDRVFCMEGNVGHVAELVQKQCAEHACVVSAVDPQQQIYTFSHFSRTFLSLEFEVRIWKVADSSRCRIVLPECPSGSQLLVEFHKLSGCSFRWKELQQRIFDALTSNSAHGFLSLSTRAPPKPDLSSMSLDDDEDDMTLAEEQQVCMNNMVNMLQGPLESQQAAAIALVQFCVTKQACDQLVACGFLKAAQTILHQVVSHKDDVPPAQLPLLRCILLTIVQAAACSDVCKSAVVQNTSVRECVGNLHACNPNMFTHELAPLAQLV